MGDFELLNQPVELVFNDDKEIRLVNRINGQELARFKSEQPIEVWLNKGGYMTFEEYSEVLAKLKG